MLHTLEIRESRSSLAGAFMAAASEGTGAVDHLRRMHESSNLPGDAHRVVHKALTSPKLQAVDPNAIQPHGRGRRPAVGHERRRNPGPAAGGEP